MMPEKGAGLDLGTLLPLIGTTYFLFFNWSTVDFWEICIQVKKQQLELDMEGQTSSKLGKGYVKAVYCHLTYLTYKQSTSCEMLSWMKHKLESRLWGEISITSDMQMTSLLWQKARRIRESLDETGKGEWKSWLKTQQSKNKDHGIWSHPFMANGWGNNGNSDRLYFLGLQNHCKWMVTAAMKLKDLCSLEEKLWQVKTAY